MTGTRIVRGLIVVGTLLVLGAVDLAVLGKERIRRGGETVFLALAPVDPRSLIQGDYMALDFGIAQQVLASLGGTGPLACRDGESGSVAVALDRQRIGRLAAPGTPGALRIGYRIRHGRVWFGTDAFFFREGDAARYAKARFGEFRVDAARGEALLVGLRGPALEPLGVDAAR